MNDIDYLTFDDVLALVSRGAFTVGDPGLLQSALARPQATVFGEDAYPPIHEKAAALFQSLAVNHAMLDGNKRMPLASLELFYALNGFSVTATDDQLFDLVIAVSARELGEVRDLAARLETLVARRASAQ